MLRNITASFHDSFAILTVDMRVLVGTKQCRQVSIRNTRYLMVAVVVVGIIVRYTTYGRPVCFLCPII